MNYLIPACSMLIIDGLYLSFIGGMMFIPMVDKIQKEKFKLNIYGAIVAYVFLIFVLYKFIIMERKSPCDAFILGFCIYGVFDGTNYALFNNYKVLPAVMDTLWGGILFYIVTLITYNVLRIKY
jgi:uncharacterized membrane protein